jgi:hypothetical protein
LAESGVELVGLSLDNSHVLVGEAGENAISGLGHWGSISAGSGRLSTAKRVKTTAAMALSPGEKSGKKVVGILTDQSRSDDSKSMVLVRAPRIPVALSWIVSALDLICSWVGIGTPVGGERLFKAYEIATQRFGLRERVSSDLQGVPKYFFKLGFEEHLPHRRIFIANAAKLAVAEVGARSFVHRPVIAQGIALSHVDPELSIV